MNYKKIIEYSIYLIALFWSGLFYFFSRGIYGSEHLLSTAQAAQGLIPFVDFFEHHGPLQYFIFAPLYNLGGLDIFPFWLIVVNALGALFIINYIFSLFDFKAYQRHLVSLSFIFFWIILDGFAFVPEPSIAILLAIIYCVLKKVHTLNLFIAGLFLGLIFLIKPNAFVLLFFALIIWQIYIHHTNIKSVIKNSALLLAGAVTALMPFIIIYRQNLGEVYYWLFQYNSTVVLELGKIWPPNISSLFFLILITNIASLILIISDIKYTRYFLPVISSVILIFISYPRYGDYHLLPALIGFLIGNLLIIQTSRTILHNQRRLYKTALILLGVVLIYMSTIYIVNDALPTLSHLSSQSEYYQLDFSATSQQIIKEKINCKSIYIYPSASLLYLRLPNLQKSKFLYPTWEWTSTEDMQRKILEDVRLKKIDCYILNANNNIDNSIIKDYIQQNFIKREKITYQAYRFNHPLLWPLKLSDQTTGEAGIMLLY